MDVNRTGAGAGEAKGRSLKQEQSRETRATLIAAARRLFAARSYADVGTEEIVRAAGMTRGALYHHFSGKAQLFEAVYEQVERDLMDHIASSAMSAASDALGVLQTGAQAFLDACEDPAVQRIALLDAPAVLGWARWREIGMRYAFGLVRSSIEEAVQDGIMERQPVEALAHLLLGAIDEAAMLIARAGDGGRTRGEVGQALERLLESLRARA